MITRYLVIDLETNVLNRGEDSVGTQTSAPWHCDNGIVMLGCKSFLDRNVKVNIPIDLKGYDLLVGHNIKFDLHYLRKFVFGFDGKVYNSEIQVWDTMLAEYILTGQDTKFASLDRLSEKYGGVLKDEKIKEYWDCGVDTADIPSNELEEYLITDVENTEKIFLAQIKEANELGMLPLIMTQMDALLATWEMEWNGMHFDKELCAFLGTEVLKEAVELKQTVEEYMAHAGVPQPLASSNQQIAAVLFGGTLKYMEPECIGVYKSGPRKGTAKFKMVENSVKLMPSIVAKEEWTTPSGAYSVADGVLNEVLDALTHPTSISFVQAVLAYRKVEKDYNTYYKGYSKLVWPDKLIHPKFNHCATHTGRLSSSAPNFQNVNGED